MNRLMVGSGGVRREGWKTLDCNPAHGADFILAIPPLPNTVKDIQWDEIEWIHGVTSLHPWDAKEALLQLRDCLSPEGKLVLEQPDAYRCEPYEHPEWLFGDPAFKDPLHMNKWAYTPLSLVALLGRLGYSRVDILPAQHHLPERDFRVEAYR